MQPVASAARFIRDQVPELGHWTDESLVGWTAHSMAQRRLICIYDADKRAVGLGAARCLTGGVPFDDWYYHDEDGDTIYADLAVATRPGVLKVLWAAMKKRFKPRMNIAFRRLRDERFRTYDFATFDKHITNGQ